MNKTLIKKCYLFLSSFVIFLIHLPFVFAKNKPSASHSTAAANINFNNYDHSLPNEVNTANNFVENIYDSLNLNKLGLSKKACYYALKGLNYLRLTGKLQNDKIISIVDFSLPSSQKRLFVIDLNNYKILFNTYVAHGENSGTEYARYFSNVPDSYKSSLGFYITKEAYTGSKGYALRLEGEENGINDNAFSRAIVMHAAPYVNEELARSRGYIGRSWGCPAIAPEMNKPIINKIKNGTCLFIYSPDKNYATRSGILRRASAIS